MAVSKEIIPKNFNGYKRDEPIEGSYFRLPKDLFNGPYKKLSLMAKTVYSLLLDRLELSRKNEGWTGIDDDLFIFFERAEIAEILGCNINTITKAFKDLKRYELIKEIRQGVKKANVIYPGKINSNCLTPKKQESRLLKNKNLDSEKLGRKDPYIIKPEMILPKNNDKEKGLNPHHSEKANGSGLNLSSLSDLKLCEIIFGYFKDRYQSVRGEQHPRYKKQQLEKCFMVLDSFISEQDQDFDSLIEIVEKYFDTPFENCDYRFSHFCNEEILMNRMYEII